MKWNRRQGRSSDVEDRRGARIGGSRGVQAGGGLGLVGVIVVLAVQLLGGGSGFDIAGTGLGATTAPESAPIPAGQDPDRDLRDFSVYVFTDVQDTWAKTFRAAGETYERSKLVLYRDRTPTGGCGTGQAAAGPFYCPADKKVYLDLSFYQAMERQLGAEGDFAWAYVIAHEVGHHVQNLTGTAAEVDRLSRENGEDRNALSVRQELQADCYSGVWARSVFDQLEPGDLEEAFGAAEAVGDDTLQRNAGQRVNTDAFTHGSAAQRERWFRRGADRGEPGAGDTFGTDDL